MAARTQPTMMGIRSFPGDPLSHTLSSWNTFADTFSLKASSLTLERVRAAEKWGDGLWVVVVLIVVVVLGGGFVVVSSNNFPALLLGSTLVFWLIFDGFVVVVVVVVVVE